MNALTLKVPFFWDVNNYRRFGIAHCLHLPGPVPPPHSSDKGTAVLQNSGHFSPVGTAQHSRPTESYSAPLWITRMSHTFTFIQQRYVMNFAVFVTTVFYKILSDRQLRRIIQIHQRFRDISVSWRWKRSRSPKRLCIRITWCGCRPEILQRTVC